MKRIKSGSMFMFPLAALFNSYAMTGLLLAFGIAGNVEMAADIGLVQAASLALFYAFSANGRNFVLADDSGKAAADLLRARLHLMLPLAIATWVLSSIVGEAGYLLSGILILRRLAEWIGEIGLAVQERDGEPAAARKYLVAEACSSVALILLTILDAPAPLSLLPWALAPLVAINRKMRLDGKGIGLRALLPHFGSTVAIGTSTYVFRISIALLGGKAFAGERFTAFAVGGLIPTLFGHALAPTLARHYQNRRWPRRLILLPLGLVAVATSLALVAHTAPEWLFRFEHSKLFWMATAASIAGGALMSIAMVLRTKLIQGMKGDQVYGPDLLANVLIATSVPYAFSLFGKPALGALYLLSAGLNLLFYWGAGKGVVPKQGRIRTALIVIGAAVVLPVFFQLKGGIFHNPALVFDTEGDLFRLPLPLSVVAVFAGMAWLGNFSAALRTLTTLFFTAVLFVLTSLLVTAGDPVKESAKLMLLAQFLLPLFGMVLGEMYGAASSEPLFERTATAVLLVVLPAQMLCTWSGGHFFAHPDVFAFSIYQHLQYYPMIVAALALMASMSSREKAAGNAVRALWCIVAIQLVASVSIGAMVAAASGLVCFCLWYGRSPQQRKKIFLTATLATSLGIAYALAWNAGPSIEWGKQAHEDMTWRAKLEDNEIFREGHSRLHYWKEYGQGAMASAPDFLFGHAARPDRKLFPSAHNYWLDAVYNFGIVSILPLIALLAVTGRMAWQRRRVFAEDPVLLANLLACFYLIFLENMLKVGMRQPYPGLITMFLLGLFISRLRRHGQA